MKILYLATLFFMGFTKTLMQQITHIILQSLTTHCAFDACIDRSLECSNPCSVHVFRATKAWCSKVSWDTIFFFFSFLLPLLGWRGLNGRAENTCPNFLRPCFNCDENKCCDILKDMQTRRSKAIWEYVQIFFSLFFLSGRERAENSCPNFFRPCFNCDENKCYDFVKDMQTWWSMASWEKRI